jgi:hypothetical protein
MSVAPAAHDGGVSAHVPPGWPPSVPPPEAEGWRRRAVGWLLDLCPADYRRYDVLARHPVVLARLASHHVAAQLDAQQRATATVRADLRGHVAPQVIDEVLQTLDVEQARLLQARRAVDLVERALRGRRYVPRL